MDEFANLPTTPVSDGLDGKNHMDIGIKPLSDDWHVYGRAFTVDAPAGENISLLEGIYNARPGDVLIVDGKGWTANALAGDFVIGLAKTLDLHGVVIDGVIRDIADIRELDFPVFSRGSTTAASKKTAEGTIGQPVTVGGVEVNTGDIIVGDVDGVVAVPAAQAAEVAEKAKARIEKDEKREADYGGSPEKAREYIDNFLRNNKKG
ncbi:RraA family protein [Natribacillus halophilus]|uniref:Putative 4-hydroxy-4-methyl-2-oxoglutarate aldolase n=1 Tax=Natribacillus halophilus TaxID=549003 RepID=A0A1G8QCW7_9BACI|nr:RraA family protein [Natribacillus halophilus]SDJ02468.1 Regulator of RNase E activity RraA [Natribacillus halophilus]